MAFQNWFVPSLLMVLAIPLIARLVPPNMFYGFRTPRTMSDDDVWYEANWGAGWDMVYAGVAMLVLAFVKPWIATFDGMKPGVFLAFAQLPFLLVGVGHSFWRLRKL